MGNHWVEKHMGNHWEARREDTCGTKEERKEGETKEKEKEDSLASVIIADKRDTAQGSVRSWDREKEIKEQTQEKDSRVIASSADNSGTARIIAGMAKAKEAKEEHM